MNSQTMQGRIGIWILFGLVLALSGIYYFWYEPYQLKKEGNYRACTEEAKLCPDGKTYVSRTGPNCEFAKCPGENTRSSAQDFEKNTEKTAVDTSNWKTYRNEQYGFEVRYPLNWTIKEYTNGYNEEGPYVLVFETGNYGPQPFISVRDKWSFDQEIERINTIDPPLTKVLSVEEFKLGSMIGKDVIYQTTVGLEFKKTIFVRGTVVFMFNSEINNQIFQQFFSTFKFID